MTTVRVKSDHPDHEQGFFVINEEDFDPKKHELWEADQPIAAGTTGQESSEKGLSDEAPNEGRASQGQERHKPHQGQKRG